MGYASKLIEMFLIFFTCLFFISKVFSIFIVIVFIYILVLCILYNFFNNKKNHRNKIRNQKK